VPGSSPGDGSGFRFARVAEFGRRTTLRPWRRKAWVFESPRAHQEAGSGGVTPPHISGRDARPPGALSSEAERPAYTGKVGVSTSSALTISCKPVRTARAPADNRVAGGSTPPACTNSRRFPLEEIGKRLVMPGRIFCGKPVSILDHVRGRLFRAPWTSSQAVDGIRLLSGRAKASRWFESNLVLQIPLI
jgi:hypothetical protein